jgi:hypothetical protein
VRHVTRSKTNLPRSSKKEPLAEGLQIVPTGPSGLRLWSRMKDEQIVEYARKVMKENRITGNGELRKVDRGLDDVLRRRGLLDEVGFEEKRVSWEGMSNEELVGLARKVMKELEITGRSELKSSDVKLYSALQRRELLDEVGFEEKYRSWKDITDEEVVEVAREVMEEKEITGRYELEKADRGLYQILQRRGLRDRAFAKIDQQRNDQARDAVIDALEAFGPANDNDSAEDDVA